MKNPNGVWVALVIGLALWASSASGTPIGNGVPFGTLGHWSVDVQTGGESRSASLTANRFASGDVVTEQVLFDYFSYVDVGGGGVRLSGSAAQLNADGSVTSSGAFVGSGGNTINWNVSSSIDPGSSIFESVFTFDASQGTLGDLRFFQYLDEDIEGVSDDVFLTRGSVSGLDLELFTIDDTEVYGVSHSGALAATQGLDNAVFAGWAAGVFDSMRPAIGAGTQNVALAGIISASLPFMNHPQLGGSWGPRDIVSVMAWDVNSTGTSATIVTTLGGVPDITDIPGGAPEPGTLSLWILGGAALLVRRRRTFR